MVINNRRVLAENIVGVFFAMLGIISAAFILWYHRETLIPQVFGQNQQPTIQGKPVQAKIVSSTELQQRLDNIEKQKKAIEAARLAKIRAAQEAKRRAEEAKRKVEEAKRQAAQEAQRKQAEEKRKKLEEAKQKALAEKALADKKAAEKVAKANALKQQKKKADAAAKLAAQKKQMAEKAAKEAAAKAKKAAELAKLAAIKAPPLTLSSFDSKAQAQTSALEAAAKKAAKDAALAAFVQAVTAKVWARWVMPINIPDNLHATVFVTLDKIGNIKNLKISSSSGNTLYDNSVLTALKYASPLPMPNNIEIRDLLIKEGVEFTF